MSWMNPDARLDAEDCIRMMRFMARNIRDERKTVEKCVKTYQRMFPDWEREGNEKHHFFYDITFIQDAIHDFSFWLETAADEWEGKINDGRGGEDS